jgi:ammonia channel protein AmtB
LITGKVMDTGGSILIHAFGAIFGLGVAASMTTRKESQIPLECDDTSDRYSLLGSMVLWVFWPSFCSAFVAPADVPKTAVNVILFGAQLKGILPEDIDDLYRFPGRAKPPAEPRQYRLFR